MVDLFSALHTDILTALRLAAICVNPVACACQVMLMMKPSWMDALPNEVRQCKGSDIFSLIADKIMSMVIESQEAVINEYVMGFLRDAIGWLGVNVNDVCIPYKDTKLCPSDPKMLEALFGCSTDDASAHQRCFYERQKSICMTEDDSLSRYQALFHSSSASEFEAEFRSIVGDSYESIPPAMMQAFKDADVSDTGFNVYAQRICDSSMKQSMTLDQLILSCVFHHFEKFCPDGEGDDELDTFLKQVDWKLPKVRFDFGAPPPPPPATFGPFEDLERNDPEGMELLREKLGEFWPALTYVASQTYGNSNPLKHDPFLAHRIFLRVSNRRGLLATKVRPASQLGTTPFSHSVCAGSNIGRDRSETGIGYGPLYYVSRYSMSTAFLSTSHFKNQDSLSARMVQARFTGMFRFSCKAFKGEPLPNPPQDHPLPKPAVRVPQISCPIQRPPQRG